MNLTDTEQDIIQKCLTNISSILISKKTNEIKEPTLKGTINVKDENTKITFNISVETINKLF